MKNLQRPVQSVINLFDFRAALEENPSGCNILPQTS